MTGALSNAEISIRSSIGFFLFVPRDLDERLLAASGFEVQEVADRSANMATVARRWHDARARHGAALREIEGEQTFEGCAPRATSAASPHRLGPRATSSRTS